MDCPHNIVPFTVSVRLILNTCEPVSEHPFDVEYAVPIDTHALNLP